MLNQPTRAAFAQDFLVDAVDGSKVPASGYWPRLSLNEYQLASSESPVRLTRFARVLKESSTAFRGCHISHFPKAVRPYFGDFAVCPYCLAEGFHSVLYSFEGLRVCPAHGTKMERLKNCGSIASDLFINALRNPFGNCPFLQKTLKSAETRIPKRHVGRDSVLGDIASWLMDIESRCWLGRHGAQHVDPLLAFTNRLVHLKTSLGLANAAPNWADVDGNEVVGSTNIDVIRFGSMRVQMGDLVHIDDRRAVRHQIDLNVYGQTIFGDFKSIRRNLERRLLRSRGRHWLGRLTNATDNTNIDALLSSGGEQAPSVFKYEDMASVRASIMAISDKLRTEKIGLIGLGGTGSYILDLVAKTPVGEIHLYDGDQFETHNAFRAPGAASAADLAQNLSKVDYFAARYAPMRNGIVSHKCRITENNLHLLDELDFVFVAVDSGPSRRLICEHLQSVGIAFIDVGMDVQINQQAIGLYGMFRVTLSTPEQSKHFFDSVPTFEDDGEGLYRSNIQVADLNMCNAAHAVICWKQYRSFYLEHNRAHHRVFTLFDQKLQLRVIAEKETR